MLMDMSMEIVHCVAELVEVGFRLEGEADRT